MTSNCEPKRRNQVARNRERFSQQLQITCIGQFSLVQEAARRVWDFTPQGGKKKLADSDILFDWSIHHDFLDGDLGQKIWIADRVCELVIGTGGDWRRRRARTDCFIPQMVARTSWDHSYLAKTKSWVRQVEGRWCWPRVSPAVEFLISLSLLFTCFLMSVSEPNTWADQMYGTKAHFVVSIYTMRKGG